MKSELEKQLEIQLLTEKLQRISGKKIVLEDKEKKIIDFINVKVGDIAFENPDMGGDWNNSLGVIVWKGTGEELLSSKYKSMAKDMIQDSGMEKSDIYDYVWVIVDEETYGLTVYNYNGDPSGCVVFKNDVIAEDREIQKNILKESENIKPYKLKKGEKYTWFMGAEPLECTFIGETVSDKTGLDVFEFQLDKSKHKLSIKDVKAYIFPISVFEEYQEEQNKPKRGKKLVKEETSKSTQNNLKFLNKKYPIGSEIEATVARRTSKKLFNITQPWKKDPIDTDVESYICLAKNKEENTVMLAINITNKKNEFSFPSLEEGISEKEAIAEYEND